MLELVEEEKVVIPNTEKNRKDQKIQAPHIIQNNNTFSKTQRAFSNKISANLTL